MVLSALAVAFVVAVMAPANANAGTLAQARGQLRAWHLHPAPLFPARLPAGFQAADVTLQRWPGTDFNLLFAMHNCAGVNFCVALKRLGPGALSDILHDPVTTSVRKMRIGTRVVYAAETGHSGAPALLAWHEQGRTYMASEKYADLEIALPRLVPLVKQLRPL